MIMDFPIIMRDIVMGDITAELDGTRNNIVGCARPIAKKRCLPDFIETDIMERMLCPVFVCGLSVIIN